MRADGFWVQVKIQLELDRRRASYSTACTRRGCAARFARWNGGDSSLSTHEKRLLRVNGPAKDRTCTGVKGGCGCEHAEMRLIVDFLRNENLRARSIDWILLTTLSPCTQCAHLIVRSGLTRQVFYHELLQHDQFGVEILRNAGVDARRIGA